MNEYWMRRHVDYNFSDESRWACQNAWKLADLPAQEIVDKLSMGVSDRREFIRKYGFSMPCLEARKVVERYGPTMEVMAGTGYWAKVFGWVATDSGARVTSAPSTSTWRRWTVSTQYICTPVRYFARGLRWTTRSI